jgi:hypothetical protein
MEGGLNNQIVATSIYIEGRYVSLHSQSSLIQQSFAKSDLFDHYIRYLYERKL